MYLEKMTFDRSLPGLYPETVPAAQIPILTSAPGAQDQTWRRKSGDGAALALAQGGNEQARELI